MEDNLDPIEDTQFEDEDEMFSSTEEEEEEVIDYDGMKSALEMFQQVCASALFSHQTHSHSLLGVKEALDSGVDLVEYGQKIDNDLAASSKSSVDDYLAASKQYAQLHKHLFCIAFHE